MALLKSQLIVASVVIKQKFIPSFVIIFIG